MDLLSVCKLWEAPLLSFVHDGIRQQHTEYKALSVLELVGGRSEVRIWDTAEISAVRKVNGA